MLSKNLQVFDIDDVITPGHRANVAGPITANSSNVWIGWDSHRSEWTWNGRIDDVRIYSYALTAAEVKGLYEGREPPRDRR